MTDAYDITLDRNPQRVVVKIYRDGDDTAPLEWSRLEFAQRVTAPVPKPIAADLDSVWFGRPAVVMSRLPGRPDLTPKDATSWVGALARALAELHDTPLDGAGGAVTRPAQAETWRPPAGEHDPLTAVAVNAVTARLPSLTSDRVFTHGDFHPANVLWYRGRTSDELAVYDLMCVLSGRHYAAESLAVDSKLGHVPNLRSALAQLDEHLRRTLRRLDQ